MKNVAEWINYASNYWPPLSKEARQKRFIIEEKEEKVFPESCSLCWEKKIANLYHQFSLFRL